jgi:hypothetical protein
MSYDKRDRNFLKGVAQYRVKAGFEASVFEQYLDSLDHPRALTVWLLYKTGEHEQLAKLAFDPLHYNSVEAMRSAYSATKFLSKFEGLTLEYDLAEVALKKFFEFELLCKQTNGRFRNLSTDPLYKGSVVWLHNAVIRKIESVLGQFCPEEFASAPDWGPGASTLIKRRDASSAIKFQNETGITRDLYSLLPNELLEKIYPHWSKHLQLQGYPQFQVGSKVITVPKDATTDRVIAVEPGINIWFQKSLGSMINRRLLRFGVDLRHQERNQNFALLGSKLGSIATVDLSSASDSISQSVVEALFPPQWYSVLDSCRTKYGLVKDKTVRWEKFSSMGNGFTFSLESLIFYAVAFCCTEYVHADTNHVSVYGDDIIVPVSAFRLLSEVLSFYGFRVNGTKSHFDSMFRESCGSHYYSGFDVKPIYVKRRVSSLLSVFRLANAIRRQASRSWNNMACDASSRPVFEYLVQSVPKGLRLRIPDGQGDGGFVSNFDEATPSRARHGVEGHRYRALEERSKSVIEERIGYHLSVLWEMSKREEALRPLSSVPLTLEAMFCADKEEVKRSGRNSVPLHATSIGVVHGVIRQWSDLGPWID